jgi:hypothetical protein
MIADVSSRHPAAGLPRVDAGANSIATSQNIGMPMPDRCAPNYPTKTSVQSSDSKQIQPPVGLGPPQPSGRANGESASF